MSRIETIGNATLYLGDCREILPILPKVDAVITDPPYGLGRKLDGGSWGNTDGWDDSTVDAVLGLPELAPCVIWGGNYYDLPPSRGWLSWFKPDAPPSMAHFELAWTSLDRNARQLSVSIAETNPHRVGHPTQKPLRLMEWCLSFVPDANNILDPFMGSGTTGVACMNLQRQFIGIEMEVKYFDIACRRIDDAQRQSRLFGGVA